MTEVCGISERRDAEKLLFLSRLVQRGISQTSQGGLARWVYTLAAEARNLASRGSTGREEIIKAVRERHPRLSENRKKGSNSGHTLYAGDGAGGGHGKGGGHDNGKGGRRGKHQRGRLWLGRDCRWRCQQRESRRRWCPIEGMPQVWQRRPYKRQLHGGVVRAGAADEGTLLMSAPR